MPASAQREKETSADAVRAEQIRTLYSQSVGLSLVNPLNAAIVVAVLWPSHRPELLLGWLGTMAAVALARVILRRRYLQILPPPGETSLWARRFVVGAVASGALWGVAGALFYDSQLVSALL